MLEESSLQKCFSDLDDPRSKTALLKNPKIVQL